MDAYETKSMELLTSLVSDVESRRVLMSSNTLVVEENKARPERSAVFAGAFFVSKEGLTVVEVRVYGSDMLLLNLYPKGSKPTKQIVSGADYDEANCKKILASLLGC